MDTPVENRRCWAEVDLSAIRHNAEIVRTMVGPGVGIMAVVKANAYGHGVDRVALALRDIVSMFGVASLHEARHLHAALSSADPKPAILILGAALPSERPGIVAGGFIPAISSLKEAAAYSGLAAGRRVPIHLAIDTGMGRMGIPDDATSATVAEILHLPNLAVTGVATHLPVADEDEQFTRDELARFQSALAALREAGVDAPFVHALNSAGIIAFPQHAGTMVRAGLMLYGISPLPEHQSLLRPALTLKTRVTLIREVPAGHGISYGRAFVTPGPMRVATLAIGYADGYHRHLSGQGADVLIHGQRCPLLGRVTMDQIMVDVTHVSEAAIEDEAILIGAAGKEQILASELATKSGTIPWEIFTSIGTRVDRLYS